MPEPAPDSTQYEEYRSLAMSILSGEKLDRLSFDPAGDQLYFGFEEIISAPILMRSSMTMIMREDTSPIQIPLRHIRVHLVKRRSAQLQGKETRRSQIMGAIPSSRLVCTAMPAKAGSCSQTGMI